jgi:hypothetical protein
MMASNNITGQTARFRSAWEPFMTDRDLKVIAAGGFAQDMGFGCRPAVIVLDADQFGAAPTVGEADAVRALGRLLRAARTKRIPVVFATASSELPSAPGLEPEASDIAVVRCGFSAFCGTPLYSFMIELGVDSLLIGGFGTSAAVRSTVVEGFSANFRCALVADACWDEIDISHAISLCDLSAKYADLLSSADCAAFIDTLSEGLFPNLPPPAREIPERFND